VGDGPPAGFGALIQALAVEPLDARQAARAADATWDFTRNGFAVLSFGVVEILVAMGLYATGTVGAEAAVLPCSGSSRPRAARPLPGAPGHGSRRGLARAAAPADDRAAAAVLAPSDGEGVRVMGGTSFGGTRHGRIVAAEVAANGSVVAVTGAVEPFRAVSDAERLEVVEGPSWVATALTGAGRDPRWRQVE
jgi:hypothetical protein